MSLLSDNERTRIIGSVENKTGIRISNSDDVPELLLPLQWGEILGMAREGIVTIGSHGKRHSNLTTCTDEELEEDIVESRRIIEQKLDRECRMFCYPGGKCDERVKRFVMMAGYSCAVTTENGFEAKGDEDKFAWPRISIGRSVSFFDFVLR